MQLLSRLQPDSLPQVTPELVNTFNIFLYCLADFQRQLRKVPLEHLPQLDFDLKTDQHVGVTTYTFA